MPPDPNKYPNPQDDPFFNGEQLEIEGLGDASSGGDKTSTTASGGGVRQTRDRDVQRVRITDFDPEAARHIDNLRVAIHRLEHLMKTHTAPELSQQAIQGAEGAQDRVTDSVKRSTSAIKQRHEALQHDIRLEDMKRNAVALTSTELERQLAAHQMLANSDDIVKRVTYHYVDEGGRPQESTESLRHFQQRAERIAQGKGSPEDIETHQRVITDLVSRQAEDEAKIDKHYQDRLKAINRQVKDQQEFERSNKRVDDLLKRGTGYIVDRARGLGVITGTKLGEGTLHYIQRDEGKRVIGTAQMSEDEFGELMRASHAGQMTPEQQKQYDDIRETLRRAVPIGGRGVTGQDSEHFRITEVISNLARGNFGGAIGEMMQRFPSRSLDRLNEAAVRAGTRVTTSLGGGGMATATGNLIPRVVGLATTPAGVFGAFEAARYGLDFRRRAMEAGMITGEGPGAGLALRGSALLQGVNPFDIVSQRQAIEFQIAARQQGFRGRDADALSQIMGDVVNHLGTDWKQALELTVRATQEGGSTLKEFRNTLMDLRDTARETGTSVQSLQEGLNQWSQAVISAGGTQRQATRGFNMFQQTFRNTFLGKPIGAQQLQQWMQQSSPILAMSQGIPIWNAMNMQPQQRARALDQFVTRINQQRPRGMGIQEWARQLSVMGLPQLQGLDAQGILALLRTQSRGGFTAGAMRADAQQLYEDARRATTHHGRAWTLIHHPVRYAQQDLVPEEIRHGVSGAVHAIGGLLHHGDSRMSPEQAMRNYNIANNIIAQMKQQGYTADQMQRRVQVEIKMHPDLKRFLLASSEYQDYLKGHRGGQGVQRPPGG